MSHVDRYEARRQARHLREPVEGARELAERLGLEPVPVNYWIVDYDEMNELIAYDGFQSRYPHWRWGMKYDRQRKQGRYTGGKAFEIVNNDSPANAFLQESNTLADQKAVITHVEAHADFFANNQWFGMFPDDEPGGGAAAMLERHARRIQEYMEDPEIDREDVERWVDNVLTLADTIDQHRAFTRELGDADEAGEALAEQLSDLAVSEEVREEVFDEEWLEAQEEGDAAAVELDVPEADVLAFLREYGMTFDEDSAKATPFEPWQRDVLEMLREEAYYFAAQRMTKIMNEGWAAYWESVMMAGENFADTDEFLTYADHMAQVLGSPGLNPYKLGLELWTYVENLTNRREVYEQLLRVEGVTWRTVEEVVDLEAVLEELEPPWALANVAAASLEEIAALPEAYVDQAALDRARSGDLDWDDAPWRLLSYEGLARRHYSLARPEHRGFLAAVSASELERIGRYVFDGDRYETVEEALAEVDHTAGWDRMREIRASHNDVTFVDEFLTGEFVAANDYFTFEYSHAAEEHRVSSTDPEAVKQKLLLQFTNLGKPTIRVEDGNYGNRNELLLAHQYNGVALDVEQAERVLERTFELWGRPVNLKTIVKELDEHDVEVARRRSREPEPEEQGRLLRYDGEEIVYEDLAWDQVEHLAADDVDYDTKPEEWLQ